MTESHASLVLLLDTAGPWLQLGVWYAGCWQYRYVAPAQEPRAASALLFAKLEQAFAGLNRRQLTDMAVITGPGSFTGLRTGLTVAQTLWQCLPGLRCYPVSMFQAVARPGTDQTVVIAALRSLVYVAEVTADGALHQPRTEDLSAVHEVWPHLRVDSRIESCYLPEAWQAEALQRYDAISLEAVLTGVQTGRFRLAADPSELEPLYIQPPRITRKALAEPF